MQTVPNTLTQRRGDVEMVGRRRYSVRRPKLPTKTRRYFSGVGDAMTENSALSRGRVAFHSARSRERTLIVGQGGERNVTNRKILRIATSR